MTVIRTMSESERAWLAAAIDGEGSLGIYMVNKAKPQEGRRMSVQVSNTNLAFVRRVRDIVGAGTITARDYLSKLSTSQHQGKNTMYQFSLRGHIRGMQVISQILPYLIIKREKAESILEELREKPFGRWAAATPEAKKKQSNRTKQTWQNPEIRGRRVAGMKQYWARRRANYVSLTEIVEFAKDWTPKDLTNE